MIMAETTTMTNTLVGTVPAKKLTRDELVRTHRSHLKKQDLSPDAPRPVKQPMLEELYNASTKSIRDLEIVFDFLSSVLDSCTLRSMHTDMPS
jgi:hypothetical protein